MPWKDEQKNFASLRFSRKRFNKVAKEAKRRKITKAEMMNEIVDKYFDTARATE